VIVKNTELDICTDLHVPSSATYENVFLDCSMYVCMCASSAPEQLDGFYLYSAFKTESIIGPCSVNMNIISKKIGALQIGPKTKEDNFSKKSSKTTMNNFQQFR
jgi:hypothetical protein